MSIDLKSSSPMDVKSTRNDEIDDLDAYFRSLHPMTLNPKEWCMTVSGLEGCRFYIAEKSCLCNDDNRTSIDKLRFHAAGPLAVMSSTSLTNEKGVREWIFRLDAPSEISPDQVRWYWIARKETPTKTTESLMILFRYQQFSNRENMLARAAAHPFIPKARQFFQAMDLNPLPNTNVKRGGMQASFESRLFNDWDPSLHVRYAGCAEHERFIRENPIVTRDEHNQLISYAQQYGWVQHSCPMNRKEGKW